MNNPLVSIIITFYNAEKYLKKLLESISQQTISDLEIIIIDDKSNEDSHKSLIEIGKIFPDLNIQISVNEANMRLALTRNKGISLSKGKYITVFDPDDMLCGRYSLEQRVNFLEQNNDFAGIAGYDLRIDENGSPLVLPRDNKVKFFRQGVTDSKNLRKIYAMNLTENTGPNDSASTLFFYAGSSLFRREDVIDFPFDPNFEFEEDVEWLMRFLEKKSMKLEMNPFHFRRMHESQYHNKTPREVTAAVIKLADEIVRS